MAHATPPSETPADLSPDSRANLSAQTFLDDVDGADNVEDEAQKLRALREKERELEKERPCVFKSLSPVSEADTCS